MPLGGGTLKRFLLRSQAHVICAQELQLRTGVCAEASQWAWRHEWKSLFSPSVCGDGGGSSAGVVIFVRKAFGLREPSCDDAKSCEVVPSRITAGVVELPGCPKFMLASGYLQCGEGPSMKNLQWRVRHLVGLACLSSLVLTSICHLIGSNPLAGPADVRPTL